MEPKNLFEGKLVRLRAVEPGDEEVLFRQWRETRITRLDSDISWPASTAQIRAWIERKTSQKEGDDRHMVIETLSGKLVGGVNTQLCDPRNGVFSIGIGIGDREEWGKGYAREAMLLVLRFMFHEMRYQKCNIGVYDFNHRAVAFYRRLGFVDEGRLRRTYFSNDTYHDEILLGITREEFNNLYPDWHVTLDEPDQAGGSAN